MKILKRTVCLGYLILYRNLVILSSVLGHNLPHAPIQQYRQTIDGDQTAHGPFRREDDGNFLTSPAGDIIEIGAIIILGGAAIATGIQAANSAREISNLRLRISTVCGALQRAAVVSTASVPPVPILDPIGRNALSQVNDVIRALVNISTTSCNL